MTPNIIHEDGITTARLWDLVEVEREASSQQAYTTGVVISTAVNDPKALRKLWSPSGSPAAQASGMLKPVKRKRDHG